MQSEPSSSHAVHACFTEEDGSVPWGFQSYEGTLLISTKGQPSFVVINKRTRAALLEGMLTAKTAWRASKTLLFLKSSEGSQANGPSLAIRCSSPSSADAVEAQIDQALKQHQGLSTPPQGNGRKRPHIEDQCPPESDVQGNGNDFDVKIDKGSAEMYFKYYGMLQHQQNMLQDYIRTGIYHKAITSNKIDFKGKTVMDVGAGSGILSLFAAQAGASKVYAVEASGIVGYTQQLADGNAEMGKKLQVIHAKVEEVDIPEKVDVLISEPMGTLLVNERMLETYLYARDRFLRPGGKMFPQIGRIHVALFSDDFLHQEVMAKATFWTQEDFFKVDLSPLYSSAVDGYFSQVVVDAFDTSVLASGPTSKIVDLGACSAEDLQDIIIPIDLEVTKPGPCAVHGLACWFDVLFPGTNNPTWLTTAPGQPTTHWFQLRCLLKSPVYVPGPGHRLQGSLHLRAHKFQSYDVHLTLMGPPLQPEGPPQTSTGSFDLKEPYYRQLTPAGWWVQATACTSQDEYPTWPEPLCDSQQQQQQQWMEAQLQQWGAQAVLQSQVEAAQQEQQQQGEFLQRQQPAAAAVATSIVQQQQQPAAGSLRSLMQV